MENESLFPPFHMGGHLSDLIYFHLCLPTCLGSIWMAMVLVGKKITSIRTWNLPLLNVESGKIYFFWNWLSVFSLRIRLMVSLLLLKINIPAITFYLNRLCMLKIIIHQALPQYIGAWVKKKYEIKTLLKVVLIDAVLEQQLLFSLSKLSLLKTG